MRRLACVALLALSAAAQTGAWQPPIAAPKEDRTPPAWVASVRAEVAAAVAEAMAPVVAAMREARPASMPAPVVAAPAPAVPVAPSEPWWRSGEFSLAVLALMGALTTWLTVRVNAAHRKAGDADRKANDAFGMAADAAPAAVAAVRVDRGPPRKELAEAVAQQQAQGLPIGGGPPVAPPGFRLVPLSEVQS